MSTSKRRRVYIPTWEGEVEGWTVNHLTANLWRVQRTKDRDDCMQEAYCVFMRVVEKYPDVEAPHFMALYKTAWTRAFHDFATEDSALRGREVLHSQMERDDAKPMEAMGETHNEGELRVLLRQAPREVRMVLNLLLRAPQEILDTALRDWKPDDRRNSTGMNRAASMRVNALLGLPLERNTLQEVRDYFT